MTTGRTVALVVIVVCLGGVLLAQDEDLPLSNWAAPPYWSPAVQQRVEGEPGGEMIAHAQGMQAQAEALPSSPLPFVAIAPCRIVDTRVPVSDGFHQPNFANDEARTFNLPASPDCTGLPATAGAWSVNIQFRPISQLCFLTAYPTGTTMPVVSTLTAGPAAWVQNAALVPAGTGGAIDIYCQYAGRLVIDINGYYTLFLPFSGSAGSAAGTDLFTVQNTGAGRAMHAITSTGTALFAESGSGTGGLFTGFHGVDGYGTEAGGYFKDANNSGYANVGYGDYGIIAYGNAGGGYFKDLDHSGYAYVGYGDIGIYALGNTTGGYFKDADHSGYTYVGFFDRGISAYGNQMGGYFQDLDSSGYALVGYGDRGIEAYGNQMGGYFKSGTASGYAYVASADVGIAGWGNFAGAQFADINSSGWSYVGYSTYKIAGNGDMAFVQNHPTDPGAVIVYAAPEGDEVATYTRGTARLVGGEAHVPLGDTFKWVTNPDIGLTAHLTPHGEAVPLAVVSVSTEELVVRGPADAPDGLVFDYLVYGLRIGFEETTVVQEKTRESYIPAMTDHRELLARRPELARYTALARYSAGREALGIKEPLKLERANALKAAIHEFDPAVDTIEKAGPSHQQSASTPPAPGVTPGRGDAAPSAPLRQQLPGETPGSGAPTGVVSVTAEQDLHARSFSSPREQLATRVAVAGTVEPGDVLVVDREHPEFFVRGERPADPAVVGVVVGDAGVALGAPQSEGSSAQVALSGIARCKVDASFGAIAPGDLLVSAPTPGHAMRDASPLPGTVVGKALEPLASGQGIIRILVMPR